MVFGYDSRCLVDMIPAGVGIFSVQRGYPGFKFLEIFRKLLLT